MTDRTRFIQPMQSGISDISWLLSMVPPPACTGYHKIQLFNELHPQLR